MKQLNTAHFLNQIPFANRVEEIPTELNNVTNLLLT